MVKSKITRGMTKDGFVRFFLVDSTAMVERAREIHGTSPISTAALGRTLTATSLLGGMCKNENEKVTLQIKGSNQIKTILSVSDCSGNVKGYISDPMVDLPLRDDGKLPVGDAVGKDGRLVLIRDLGLKEPYIGNSNLISGEIAEDLAAYFMYSEQQPSFVSLGVFIGKDMTVEAAGGLIVQPLPNAPDDIIDKLEGPLAAFPPISQLIQENMSFEDMIALALYGFETEILGENEVEYRCDCTKDKIDKALISLGKEELNAMIEEDGKAEVVCHFCDKKYGYSKNDLENLLLAATN